jgi:hypothetical protein
LCPGFPRRDLMRTVHGPPRTRARLQGIGQFSDPHPGMGQDVPRDYELSTLFKGLELVSLNLFKLPWVGTSGVRWRASGPGGGDPAIGAQHLNPALAISARTPHARMSRQGFETRRSPEFDPTLIQRNRTAPQSGNLERAGCPLPVRMDRGDQSARWTY